MNDIQCGTVPTAARAGRFNFPLKSSAITSHNAVTATPVSVSREFNSSVSQ